MRRIGTFAAVSTLLAFAAGLLTNLITSGWSWPLGIGLGVLVVVWVVFEMWRAGQTADDNRPDRTKLGVTAGQLSVWRMEPRNPEFTGREELLAELHQRLHSGQPAVVQALRGLGGVGKTQIAIEYAHRYADEYDLVWWVNAEDPDLIGEQLAALSVRLRLADVSADTATAAAIVLEHLRRHDRWLLIFDNAENAYDLRHWLPGGGGHVLITSRRGGWETIAAVIDIDVMDRAESVRLLRTCHAGLTEAEAAQLAEALGDLPLALVQAGSFLAETATSVEKYLELLATQAPEVLNEGGPHGYPQSLVAVIDLSTARLAEISPPGLAMFQLCAFLAAETIPTEWLTRDLSVPAAGEARRGILWIGRYGLATVAGGGVRLHRLTQAILRSRLSSAESEAMRERARAILVGNTPGDPEDPATWPKWSRMVPHLIAVDPGSSADPGLRTLACDASWYLIERGDVDASARLAEDLRESWRAESGPDAYHVLLVTRSLARALREQGHYDQALAIYTDALERCRRVLGTDHSLTLRIAHGMAIDLHLLGRYEEARNLQREAYERYRATLGEDHPHTLHSANHLAEDLHALDEYEQARRLHEDTLERYRRVLGDDHPDTLRSVNYLAADLRSLGDLDRARELQAETLERRRRVLGINHPNTLESATSLAETLHLLGLNEDAKELQEDTYQRYTRVLGASHPETLRAGRNLAETLQSVGDVERALRLAGETFAIYQRELGANHPETLHCADCLADILLVAGRVMEARRLRAETLARRTGRAEH
ncbi:MAG: tetratricopeptide repeat protein [Hamadaea sp.]|uniref:FxSxx-COOH system tetratricopeptide repeat protein n=1 Tax=Hamadaea sp. TaxID=2024425 RepID=UPI0017D1A246|nr:FxSxx-COOH system tetratricopeptide repeat protein [Hamadaea sp.]NUR71633.1 tetratricopeptide repeat protein [Hamadaea sp.]NUT20197.1 tetratricopeptide repeat protein [Hamadaea sp.]